MVNPDMRGMGDPNDPDNPDLNNDGVVDAVEAELQMDHERGEGDVEGFLEAREMLENAEAQDEAMKEFLEEYEKTKQEADAVDAQFAREDARREAEEAQTKKDKQQQVARYGAAAGLAAGTAGFKTAKWGANKAKGFAGRMAEASWNVLKFPFEKMDEGWKNLVKKQDLDPLGMISGTEETLKDAGKETEEAKKEREKKEKEREEKWKEKWTGKKAKKKNKQDK